MRAAAVTHVRMDDMFLGIWVSHYAALFGVENCYVILDGDDWETGANLDGVNVRTNLTRFHKRIEHDVWMAKVRSGLIAELFDRYDFIVQADSDEMVFADPEHPDDLETLFAKARETGAVSCRGFEVLHDYRSEPGIDLTRPILEQRHKAVVNSHYVKPHVLARPGFLKAGGHVVRDTPYRLSDGLCMAHLASFDRDGIDRRIEERQGGGYIAHMQERRDMFHAIEDDLAAQDFDDVYASLAADWQVRDPNSDRPRRIRKGQVRCIGHHTGHLVEIPRRFAGQITVTGP